LLPLSCHTSVTLGEKIGHYHIVIVPPPLRTPRLCAACANGYGGECEANPRLRQTVAGAYAQAMSSGDDIRPACEEALCGRRGSGAGTVRAVMAYTMSVPQTMQTRSREAGRRMKITVANVSQFKNAAAPGECLRARYRVTITQRRDSIAVPRRAAISRY